MPKYRNALPQMSGGMFLSDGGMETTLIFHDGLELPHFASFVLLDSEAGRRSLKGYYEKYLAIARRQRHGLRARHRDLARQPGLGCQARLRREAR